MKPKTILLVDDDADDQYFFLDILQELEPSSKCITAKNGIEALSLLESSLPLPDLIFLDLNMPFMNGVECLSIIRKNETFKDIAIVIYSTSNDEISVKKTYELGANLFFQKPINFKCMQAKLESLLKLDPRSLLTKPPVAPEKYVI